MKTFLQSVAHDIHSKLGNDLSKVAVVFPNKRASLFFNEALATESEVPIWSPSYHSISELMESLSDLQLADDLQLITKLYYIFQKHTDSNETLDDFYFWGELLLSDFDDIDKNLVDADKLFSNLSDLKGIMDDYDFLEPEQEEAIQRFFENFSIEKRTALKNKFISLWDKLGDIYTEFRATLFDEKLAYEGMLYRYNIEKLNKENLNYNTYVFVGFNVLNEVELSLFEKLRDWSKAKYYWDYDVFYTDNKFIRHEAGEFINRNIIKFPNELDKSFFNSLNKPKKMTYISSATETAQARYLPTWIEQNLGEKERETAIVLCNESLLLPTLHSIPPKVQNLNITMGFPLVQTPIYSLIKALMELQLDGFNRDNGNYSYKEVLAVLKHPYTRLITDKASLVEEFIINKNRFYLTPSQINGKLKNTDTADDFLSFLFEPQIGTKDLCKYLTEAVERVTPLYRKDAKEEDVFDQLYRESLFKCYTVINRFLGLIESDELPIKDRTLQHLIEKVLSGSNIPFHGEPAIGMQVMGVLETRNLDFKNLVLLSVNEGLLPQTPSEASFIPYNLRKAFGMTTIEHQNAVYAYYFYRMIQRAENVTLMYNTASDGLNKGEISRFMNQLLVEWPHPIERKYIEAGQQPVTEPEIVFDKTPEIFSILKKKYDTSLERNKDRILSPSALNTYLDCKLKFYYRYIASLKAADDVNDEIDAALFGTLFHEAAETIYNEIANNQKNKLISKDEIESYLKSPYKIEQHVDNAFKKEFFKSDINERPPYNGLQLINSRVVVSYVKQLLRQDARYAPFTIIGMENLCRKPFQINSPSGEFTINIGGYIDRFDLKDGILRIVDYKTGGNAKKINAIEELFEDSNKRATHIFQTFIYADIISDDMKQYKVAPSLLYIHRAADEDYSPIIQMGSRPAKDIDDYTEIKEEFFTHLSELIQEIFEKEVSFSQTENRDSCGYCDFKALCKR